jgi:hypothetical protein
MTTVRIYKSSLLDARMKVRYGTKHGMPRGRGAKRWRLIDRVKWAVPPECPVPALDDQRETVA